MTGKSRKTRLPSPAERELWRQVTRDATPSGHRASAETAFTETLKDELSHALKDRQGSEPRKPDKPKKPQPQRPEPAAEAKSAARAPRPLTPGAFADLDKRTADRLRRGKMPIEAALDLHGMTQDAAHRALDSFLARAYDGGLRCVVVVTGKGTRSPEGGVLRRQVPLWLNQPANRGKLLAISHAQPQHGGEGALYVLLKRRRD